MAISQKLVYLDTWIIISYEIRYVFHKKDVGLHFFPTQLYNNSDKYVLCYCEHLVAKVQCHVATFGACCHESNQFCVYTVYGTLKQNGPEQHYLWWIMYIPMLGSYLNLFTTANIDTILILTCADYKEDDDLFQTPRQCPWSP